MQGSIKLQLIHRRLKIPAQEGGSLKILKLDFVNYPFVNLHFG
jgi:hypothetical protein